jgi:Big-like domain-containing protein
VASLTKSSLNADPYNLLATYNGDVNNLRSTSPVLNQAVLQTTSAAAITPSRNPSTVGQAVTFTAKITSPTVMPTGPVTFTAGNAVLGTAQLSGGKATLTTSSLPAGASLVTVTYNGSSNIAKNTATVMQMVH